MLMAFGRYLDVAIMQPMPPAIVASRPMSPDDLPIIGPLPGHERIVVATGHGMLGLTVGPITARMIADHLEGRSDIDPEPFSPARFRW